MIYVYVYKDYCYIECKRLEISGKYPNINNALNYVMTLSHVNSFKVQFYLKEDIYGNKI